MKDKKITKEELPKIGVYLTAKEWKEMIKKHEILSGIIPENEELLEIRVEGRIGYYDKQELLIEERKRINERWKKKTIIIPKNKTHPCHNRCEDCEIQVVERICEILETLRAKWQNETIDEVQKKIKKEFLNK